MALSPAVPDPSPQRSWSLDAGALRAGLVGTPWDELDVRDTVDSTNLEARRHPRAWRVVAATHQSAGRGRLTRSWDSPAGLSTAVSCVVPLPTQRPDDWGWLPLLAGVAVRDSLLALVGPSPWQVQVALKWPNDVLARRVAAKSPAAVPSVRSARLDATPWGKLAGILCELVTTGTGPGTRTRIDTGAGTGTQTLGVVGVGTNIGQERADLPVATATSLALLGVPDVEPADLVAGYLRGLAGQVQALHEGGRALAAARSAYRQACVSLGQQVVVHLPEGGRATGRAGTVDDLGRLEMAGADGRTSRFAAGDVEHLR